MKNQDLVAPSPSGRRPRREFSRLAGGRWILLTIAALLALPASGQDRVGSLSKASGEVVITRAKDGSKVEAKQVGPRVREGSVFAGDVVATGAGATATLAFGDGTLVELKADTMLSVVEKDLSALMKAGQRDKPIGRTIKILAGDIFSEIADNPNVATEFETPSGVAAVKGTKLSISVGRPESE